MPGLSEALSATLNAIDSLFVWYFLGIVILLVFSHERIDAPRKATPADNACGLFINQLPPSVIRVRRYFIVACAIYCLCLAVLLTLLTALLMNGIDFLTPDQAGVDPTAMIYGTLSFADLQTNTPNFVKAYFVRPSTYTDHPWQPAALALCMVGVLPILPWLQRFEQWVRSISLRIAGIPSEVEKLWGALRETDIPMVERVLDPQSMALMREAERYYGLLAPEETCAPERFRRALGHVLCYHSWVNHGWPNADIRDRIQTSAPTGFDEESSFSVEDLQHLVSLSHVVWHAAPTTGNEFSEGAQTPYQDPTTQPAGRPPLAMTHLNEARAILSQRWESTFLKFADQPHGDRLCLGDMSCLLVALFAESSGNIGNGDHSRGLALRDWITRGRAARSATATSFNFTTFAFFIAAVAGAVGYMLLIMTNLVTVATKPVSASLVFAFNLLVLFVPAIVPLFAHRETLDNEGRWLGWTKFTAPPTGQYILFSLIAWASCFLSRIAGSFIAPRLEGAKNSSPTLMDLFAPAKLETAGLAAIAGVVFAIFLSLSYDMENRTKKLLPSAMALIVAHMFFLGLALQLTPAYDLFEYHGLLLQRAEDTPNFDVWAAMLTPVSKITLILFCAMIVHGLLFYSIRANRLSLARNRQGTPSG